MTTVTKEKKSITRTIEKLIASDRTGTMERFISTALYSYASLISNTNREELARKMHPDWVDDYVKCAQQCWDAKD